LVRSSPAVNATAAQMVFSFHRLISSAPQMHSLQFCVALPAISFVFHPRGFGKSGFIGQVGFVSKVSLGSYQGCQVSLLFIGKDFVSFHPEFSVPFSSFAKFVSGFIVNLLGRCFGQSCFLSVEKVCIVCNNFVNLVVVACSSRRVVRSVSAPNTACS
jgi:hypothetical protein